MTPPPTGALPAVRGGQRRPSALVGFAIVLVALVVLAGVGSAAAIAMRGRHATLPSSTPSAQTIFEMPYTKGIRSARFSVTGHGVGAAWTGSGVIEFAPQHAFSLTLKDPATGTVFERDVEAGGIPYGADAGSPYRATDSELNDFAFIGWDGRPPSAQLEVTGQTTLAGQRAWVLKKAGASDRWVVAEHSGDPLQAVVSGYGTYTFNDWGQAPAIQPPDPSQVSTGISSGSGSAPVVAPAATVSVVKARVVPAPGSGDPAGFRTIALEVSYQNTSPTASNFDDNPSLVSTDGVFADTADTTVSPALQAGRVPSGQTVTGWAAFVVPQRATSFHFLFGEQLDQEQSLDYLISIAVDVPR